MMVIWVAVDPKMRPPLTSLRTSSWQPLRASLARPSASSSAGSSAVSAAKPTMTWPSGRDAASRCSTSTVCVNSTVRPWSPVFFSFLGLDVIGVKSAGAAAITITSASPARAIIASARSAVVTTATDSTPAGSGRSRFAATTVTSAPRHAAAAASARPMRPDDEFPTNRTGSSGSLVPPALTNTRLPARSRAAITSASWGRANSARATWWMSGGSGSRPGPESAPVSRPTAGSSTTMPRERRVATLAWVAACDHISVCIAGAISTGQSAVSNTLVSRSSARPLAARASRSAVAGATTTRSACRPSLTCGTSWASSNTVVCTGWPDSAAHVVSPTNSRALRVGTTTTSCPASVNIRSSRHAL